MRLRSVLLAASALAMGSAAQASEGWYISLGAGANWLQDSDYSVAGTTTTFAGSHEFDSGFIAASAIGYDWGRWRAEFEVAYRQNDLECASIGAGACILQTDRFGDQWELSQMVNVLYDVPLGGRFTGSVGAGVGGVLVVADAGIFDYGGLADVDDYVVAGQLIAQVAYDLTDRWQAYADYRFLLADDPSGTVIATQVAEWEKSDHSVMIGIRFDLQRDGAAPPPVKPQVMPQAPKQFIVFFGFNKSNLTPEAARVVSDAAAAAKEFGSASISIVGHTDTSGSNQYNLRLSMRRAQSVKDGLVDNGIPASAVSTSGRGEDELMVQTGNGVKEPQNRRATIDLN